MEFIQIIGILVGALAIARGYVKFKGKLMRPGTFIVWSLVWVGVVIISVLPRTTNLAAGLFGIGRGIDFVIYSSILVLYYLWFRLYTKLENTEKEITKIVRELSYKKKK